MGKDGGIAYRYGPSPADYGTTGNGGLPTYFKRNDISFVSDQQGGQRPCNPENCGTWQLGSWSDDVGGYSSNVATSPSFPMPAQHIGFSVLAISSVSNGVFSQKPELSWTYYGHGLDEINARAYKAAGGDATNPVAVGRCYGRPGWCMNSIMVFQNGLIGAAQSHRQEQGHRAAGAGQGAHRHRGEQQQRVRLHHRVGHEQPARRDRGGGAGRPVRRLHPEQPAAAYDWWGEWNGVYPGLPNLGNVAFMKVLGYVPLPADMKAPTEISVTTGVDRNAYLQAGVPGYDSPWGLRR